MADKQQPARLGHIDALRGIAALSVVVAHCGESMVKGLTGYGAAQWLIGGVSVSWFDIGRFGVILFFLISGFVIPYSLKGDRPLETFAVSRLFRLYPAYWLSMAATMVVAGGLGLAAYTPLQVAANVTMVPGLLKQEYISGVYWTLFVELVFYVACAMLFALRLLHNAELILLIGLGCTAVPLAGIAARACGIGAPIVYLTAHLAFLFAGYLMRLAVLDGFLRAGRYAAAVILFGLLAMPILAAQPDHKFTVATPLGVTLAGITGVLTFVLVNRRPFQPSAALVWSGAISYSVYLFHTPVTQLVRAVLPAQGAGAMAALFVLTVAGTIALASLSTSRSRSRRSRWASARSTLGERPWR